MPSTLWGVCFINKIKEEEKMLAWVIIFFIISIIAAVFGFTGIAVASASIAKFLFFIFVVLFAVSLIIFLVTERRPPPPM